MPFVFLTALTDRDNELKGRQLGADDYVTKPIDFDVLATIIAARLAGVARMGRWPKLVELNDREVEVLTWVARGKTSAEIAQILGLTKRTIDFHIDNARAQARRRHPHRGRHQGSRRWPHRAMKHIPQRRFEARNALRPVALASMKRVTRRQQRMPMRAEPTPDRDRPRSGNPRHPSEV